MQILDIKGKKWMVGLEWEILPGDATIKQESKDVAEKVGCKYGVLVDYDAVYAIGLTNKVSKVPCAALLLANANQIKRDSDDLIGNNYPDWVVLEDLGDEKYWMAVIKSGLPAPQFDCILSVTEVKDRISELLVNDTYRIFTTSGEIISIFEGIKEIDNRGLNDIIGDLTIKVKFEKLLGIPMQVIYGLIGVGVASVLVFGGMQLIEGYTLRQKAENLRKMQQAEELKQRQIYDEALKDYEKAKVENKQKAIEQIKLGLAGNPNKVLNSWYYSVGDLPAGTHGWDLKTIDCYYNIQSIPSKFACDYGFKRGDLSTNRMLLQNFPDAKISGNVAIVTRDVKIDSEAIAPAKEEFLNTLMPAKNWGFDMISQLQLLKVVNVDHDIKPSVEITYSLPAKPLSPEEKKSGKPPNAPEVVKTGYGKGEIIVKSSHFDLIREIAENVDFYGVSLRKVKFSVRDLGDIVWEATFDYYVKTQDGGVAGSSSLPTVQEASGNQQNVQQNMQSVPKQ